MASGDYCRSSVPLAPFFSATVFCFFPFIIVKLALVRTDVFLCSLQLARAFYSFRTANKDFMDEIFFKL